MSADPERSMGQDDQDQILAWEMAALPPSEEPDWYADDALGTEPPWKAADPSEPAGETPDPGDPGDEGPSAGAPFAEGGWADALAPDPVLATLVDLVQRDGLGRLDDDQLTGVLQAANRLAAWAASARVAAVSGLAARRESAARESGDWRPFDHVDDEVAVALTLTRRSAGRLLDLALGLDRLPLTRAALAAGAIDERRAEVIAEEVAGLDGEHAAAAEKLIIGRAPGLTSGQLRALVRRAVLSADPQAARRRKQKALKDARVELFPETSGTAALAGRDLPPAAVLAADKHLTALAQAMKAAGIAGTLDILRARAYLHLLSGQPAATLIPAQQAPRHPRRPRQRSSRRPRASHDRPRRRPRCWGAARHGQPDHAPVRVARLDPVPGRGPRLRPRRRRRLPHPGRPARRQPRHPVVRHPHRPRRAPRRPRLRPPRPRPTRRPATTPATALPRHRHPPATSQPHPRATSQPRSPCHEPAPAPGHQPPPPRRSRAGCAAWPSPPCKPGPAPTPANHPATSPARHCAT